VSDGIAAAISAADKAVVRNSFINPSYKQSPDAMADVQMRRPFGLLPVDMEIDTYV
jgi:hypothetical protein